MKILNIALGAKFTEGYTYQDNLLTEYQQKLGHTVTIIASTKTRNNNGEIIDTSTCDITLKNGVRLIRVSLGNKISSFLGINLSVGKLLMKVSPDIIFVHGLSGFVPFQVVRYAEKNRNVVLYADNHQDFRNTRVKGFPFSIAIALWRFLWKYEIKYFRRIYGTTSWRTDFAHEVYGIPYEKLDTLCLGVDVDKIPSDKLKVRSSVRSELNIPEDSFVYVHGGKMDNLKRTIDVVRSFMDIEDASARLIIFGSFSENIKDEVMSMIKQDSRIIYIGFVDSSVVHRYFIAADFGVFPASHSVLWEEAIGCGLPCLFGRFTTHDHLQVCNNCVQIEIDDPIENIIEVMNNALKEKSFYQKLKTNSEKASRYFSYYTIAKKSIE